MSDPPELEIDRSAPVTRTPLGDGSSWVDLRPGFARDPEGLLDHVLTTTDWYASDVWRFDRYVEERRLGAMIRADTHPALRQTGLHLESAYRVRFSGVAAIHYRDGEDFQGLHSVRRSSACRRSSRARCRGGLAARSNATSTTPVSSSSGARERRGAIRAGTARP